jgi:hypothetical protein
MASVKKYKNTPNLRLFAAKGIELAAVSIDTSF